jgi:hypothetical protein
VLVAPQSLSESVLGYEPPLGAKQDTITKVLQTKRLSATNRIKIVEQEGPGFIIYAPVVYNVHTEEDSVSLLQCVILAKSFIEETVTEEFLQVSVLLLSDVPLFTSNQSIMYSTIVYVFIFYIITSIRNEDQLFAPRSLSDLTISDYTNKVPFSYSSNITIIDKTYEMLFLPTPELISRVSQHLFHSTNFQV